MGRLLVTFRWVALCGFIGCGGSSPVPSANPPPSPAAAGPSALAPPAPPQVPSPPRAPDDPLFVEVAQSVGLARVLYCGGADKDHLLESVGTGGAFLDFDNDGFLDVFLVNAWALDEEPSRVREKGRNALYRNRGDGTYEDVTDRAGVADESWGCGVCAGDYDNDGFVDLYVTAFGPNRLYRNKGDGTFEQVAEEAGVADPGWGAGAAFFDADGDGFLDLYVANYVEATMDDVHQASRSITWRDKVKVMVGPFGLRGSKDKFYRNNGDGTFRDATEESGMHDIAESYGMGVLASDLDNDGDIDVVVTNDSNPNFLYRNEGNGKFTEVGMISGLGVNANGLAQAGMGVDGGDFDGDGLQDVLVATFAKDSATLYRNLGGLLFADVSDEIGLRKPSFDALKWGCALFDFDLDGDLDVLIVAGHIYPQVDSAPELKEAYKQRPLLLRNDNGKLVDVSNRAGPGFQVPASARGLALGDYDDDGDVDILITAVDSPPLLLRNDTPRAGRWLKLRLLDRHGSPAIGAKAVVKAGGKSFLREVRSGSTYASQNSFDLHYGLGNVSKVESVEITWPGGGQTVLVDLSPDSLVTARRPEP
ncbi:MAG: CRTAC1 family protein [Isosphaeraceae bacterium]